MVEEVGKLGLKINRQKQSMVISKTKETPICKVYVQKHEIQQVQQFKYLGAQISSDGKCDAEIRKGIGIAKSASSERTNILRSQHTAMPTRIYVLKPYMWPLLLYGCET